MNVYSDGEKANPKSIIRDCISGEIIENSEKVELAKS